VLALALLSCVIRQRGYSVISVITGISCQAQQCDDSFLSVFVAHAASLQTPPTFSYCTLV